MSYAQVRTENFAGGEDAWRALKNRLVVSFEKTWNVKKVG